MRVSSRFTTASVVLLSIASPSFARLHYRTGGVAIRDDALNATAVTSQVNSTMIEDDEDCEDEDATSLSGDVTTTVIPSMTSGSSPSASAVSEEDEECDDEDDLSPTSTASVASQPSASDISADAEGEDCEDEEDEGTAVSESDDSANGNEDEECEDDDEGQEQGNAIASSAAPSVVASGKVLAANPGQMTATTSAYQAVSTGSVSGSTGNSGSTGDDEAQCAGVSTGLGLSLLVGHHCIRYCDCHSDHHCGSRSDWSGRSCLSKLQCTTFRQCK